MFPKENSLHCCASCGALLNPSSAEPMVWPSPLKFISELDPEAKALLEAALMEANRERYYDDNVDDACSEVSDTELCCICFDQLAPSRCKTCRAHWRCAATTSPNRWPSP